MNSQILGTYFFRNPRLRVLLGTVAASLVLAASTTARADAVSVGLPDKASAEPSAQSDASYSGWWTGPLLASSARAIPQGHVLVEPYVSASRAYGSYSDPWSFQGTDRAHQTTTIGSSLNVYAGLLDRLDAGVQIVGAYRSKGDQGSLGVGDIRAQLDYQLLKANHESWAPDLLLSVKETFPTGRYKDLRPERQATDAGGGGTYATALQLNAQKVFRMPNAHLLRLRANVGYTARTDVNVTGFSAYGGGDGARGVISPGNTVSTTLAAEYHLTPSWVLALDVVHAHTNRTTFRGDAGSSRDRAPASMGSGPSEHISVAPAVEYNFNENVGLIGGVWMTVLGRNESAFVSPMMALNTFF